MGTSSDANLFFGVIFNEGFEFPWGEEDITHWWRLQNGFTENDPRINWSFQQRREWDEQNPLPVELVNYCSLDYPIIALAVADTVITAHRGYPKKVQFDPVDSEKIIAFMSFCARFGIELPHEPAWILSSYLG